MGVGLLTSSTPALAKPSAVAVNAFRSVPATALIPIAILLFGLGLEMKVSVAIYAIFWPILINTVYGVAGTEPMRLQAARSMQWGWWRRQVFVVLPSALPSITTGIRIASGTALVVVLSAELLGARSGVGTVMLRYQNALQADFVYAGTLFIGAHGSVDVHVHRHGGAAPDQVGPRWLATDDRARRRHARLPPPAGPSCPAHADLAIGSAEPSRRTGRRARRACGCSRCPAAVGGRRAAQPDAATSRRCPR